MNWEQADWFGLALALSLWVVIFWSLWYIGKVGGDSGLSAVMAGWRWTVGEIAARLRAFAYQLRLRGLERKLANADTLATLREAFRDLGISLDHLTDDELRDGALEMGELFATTGLTADEADAALESVVRAMQAQEA